MLSIFADAMFLSTGQKRWDAPDHFKGHRGPRSSLDRELEAAQRRRRAMRGAGML